MDAWERNKYSFVDLITKLIGQQLIVSFGKIASINSDTVQVALAVNTKPKPEILTCVYLNFGSSFFAINLEPQVGASVIIFTPQKGAETMFNNAVQTITDSPVTYSTAYAFCIPFTLETYSLANSLSINSKGIFLDVTQNFLAGFSAAAMLNFEADTAINYTGGAHTRSFYGSRWEEMLGMEEGIEGAEFEIEIDEEDIEEDKYIYELITTYGTWSKLFRNYQSGAIVTVGKAYTTPYAEDKGELIDTKAPVTVTIGGLAPITVDTTSKIELTIDASENEEANVIINLKGGAKFSINAADGTFDFSNSKTSLKDILLKISELYQGIITIGGPGSQALDPSLAIQAVQDLDEGLIIDFFGE
jgi:hypothetical protein